MLSTKYVALQHVTSLKNNDIKRVKLKSRQNDFN